MIDLSLVSAKLHKHLLTKIRFHTVSAPKRNISNNIMILIIQSYSKINYNIYLIEFYHRICGNYIDFINKINYYCIK